jgi:putative lipoic acid-binding regulatory protein
LRVTGNGSAFEFPCEIPVKVFGRNESEFREAVLAIVRDCFPDFSESDMSERLSREDRYLSITVTVWAEDRVQIDALYTRLSGHDAVLMVL